VSSLRVYWRGGLLVSYIIIALGGVGLFFYSVWFGLDFIWSDGIGLDGSNGWDGLNGRNDGCFDTSQKGRIVL